MTLLKFLNVFFFQWFFVRLTKNTRMGIRSQTAIVIDSLDKFKKVYADGPRELYWYSIQYFILPCTGWWSKFIYLNGKPKFYRITKNKFL